eukprot:tig00020592_g11662.t1
MTFNTRGSSESKLQQTEDFCRRWGVDFAGLQEISMSKGDIAAALRSPGMGDLPEGAITYGKLLYTTKSTRWHGNGAALWVAPQWVKHLTKKYEVPGRMIGFELRFKENRQLFVVSIYMPASEATDEHRRDQDRILQELEKLIADFSTRSNAHLLLLGDWNSVAVPELSRVRNGAPVPSRTPERKWWNTMIDTWDLRDAAITHSAAHDSGEWSAAREVTHRTHLPRSGDDTGASGSHDDDAAPADLPQDAVWHAARIDAVLVSESLDKALLSAHTCPAHVDAPHDSDHFPVLADFSLEAAGLKAPTGPMQTPTPGPPVFDPDSRKLTDEEKDELKRDLNKRIGEVLGPDLEAVGSGTREERLEHLARIHTESARLVQKVAKDHKAMKSRGSHPTKPRNLPWQAKADSKLGRIWAAWMQEPSGIPSLRTIDKIEKLQKFVTRQEGARPLPLRPTERRRAAANAGEATAPAPASDPIANSPDQRPDPTVPPQPFDARDGHTKRAQLKEDWASFFRELKTWRNRTRHDLQKLRRQDKAADISRAVKNRLDDFMDGRRLGAYIASVLEKPKSRPIMHITRRSQDGKTYEIYTEPAEVKRLLREHWKTWCQRRRPRVGCTVGEVPDSELKTKSGKRLLDFWQKEYKPRGNPALFENDMAVPSETELGDYIKTLGNTAAGPSNLSYAMAKFLWAKIPKKKKERAPSGDQGRAGAPQAAEEEEEEEPEPWGRRLLHSMVAETIRLRDLPDSVCQGNVFGIPKNGEWDGDIDNNLRPITLQEVALKLTTGLLNERLSRTIHQNGLLKGANYGFRPGCSTDDALHVFNAMLEDAKQFKKPIYVLLQDIRRAYDSVSWESMELSMRRLCIPEGAASNRRCTG